MKPVALTLAVALCATTLPGSATAQPNVAGRELVGLVRDAGGVGLEGAAVEIPGAAARTDARGAFRLWTSDSDTLTITIRRLGYSVVSALLQSRNQQWDTVVVEMEKLPQRLATAEVKAAVATRRNGLRDLEQRRAQGHGQFYTREQIVARNTIRTSEVLRDARGVRIVKLQRGGSGVRFAAFASTQVELLTDALARRSTRPQHGGGRRQRHRHRSDRALRELDEHSSTVLGRHRAAVRNDRHLDAHPLTDAF